MDNDEFINMVKKLYFIDRHSLPELNDKEWLMFRSEPARYLINAHIVLQTVIMEELKHV